MNKFEEYLKHPGVNQSFLKRLADDPQLASQKEDTKSLLRGSIVDAMMTGDFDNTYKIHKAKVPSGQLQWFTDKMVALYETKLTDDDKLRMAYEEVVKKNPGPVRDGIEKFVARFEDDAKEYYLEHISSDYLYVSQDEYDEALRHKTLLDSTTRFSGYFNNQSEDHEVLFQEPVFFTIKEVECKGLLDIIVLDHNRKTIEPVDLKTIYNVNQLSYQARKYRYDFQGAFYYAGVTQHFNEDLPGYSVEPFKFIVSDGIRLPLLYELSDTDLKVGTNGAVIRGRKYPGFIELLDDYKYYQENGHDYPRGYRENGVILTRAFEEVNNVE